MDFEIIFARPNFTVILNPKIVILGTDSIWSIETKYDFLLYYIHGKKFNLQRTPIIRNKTISNLL